MGRELPPIEKQSGQQSLDFGSAELQQPVSIASLECMFEPFSNIFGKRRSIIRLFENQTAMRC